VALLFLAGIQAYAQRFAIGPDGVSYLDLSDAVVTGQWSRLLNLYWSPLYPVLIGIARVVSRAGAEFEIPVVHAVNVVCFAAMLAAFEYLLTSILVLARRTRWSVLAKPAGVVAAYALFGFFALTMIPLELTTPDLLNAALAFVAFGAMLRMRDDPGRMMRHGVVLGAALGVAALSKSFMVPWAVVCFATLVVALRRPGMRALSASVAVWLAFVLPWSVALSLKAGRPTFGDTGRLTYAWFVNNTDTPSAGGVPSGALTLRTETILSGSGISNDTSYTDPMWADPARWNTLLAPHFSMSDQLATMRKFHLFYVESFAPLLFLIFLVVAAPSGTRRDIWRGGWMVYVPAIIGLVAYSMVLVTSRYVMPFVVTGALTLLATTPLARRILPTHLAIGFAVPLILEAALPASLKSMWFIASVVGGTLAATLVSSRRLAAWVPAAIVGMLVSLAIFPPSVPSVLRVGAAGLALLLWRRSLTAVRGWNTVMFARRTEAALVLLLGLLLLLRASQRYALDASAWRLAAAPNYGNVPWRIAQDLASRGITPGTRIALIGPHAESYWARTARLHIVANVPRLRVEAFWTLPKDQQEKLLDEFAANGATVAIATLGVVGIPTDSLWTPVKYHGRIRFLTPRDSSTASSLRD
jgi:hypothetical protein